jgi:hypothetical protein
MDDCNYCCEGRIFYRWAAFWPIFIMASQTFFEATLIGC